MNSSGVHVNFWLVPWLFISFLISDRMIISEPNCFGSTWCLLSNCFIVHIFIDAIEWPITGKKQKKRNFFYFLEHKNFAARLFMAVKYFNGFSFSLFASRGCFMLCPLSFSTTPSCCLASTFASFSLSLSAQFPPPVSV